MAFYERTAHFDNCLTRKENEILFNGFGNSLQFPWASIEHWLNGKQPARIHSLREAMKHNELENSSAPGNVQLWKKINLTLLPLLCLNCVKYQHWETNSSIPLLNLCIHSPVGLSILLVLAVLFCCTWDDAGDAVAEVGAPVLPGMSPSALPCLAFSASLAHADANMFYKVKNEQQNK